MKVQLVNASGDHCCPLGFCLFDALPFASSSVPRRPEPGHFLGQHSPRILTCTHTWPQSGIWLLAPRPSELHVGQVPLRPKEGCDAQALHSVDQMHLDWPLNWSRHRPKISPLLSPYEIFCVSQHMFQDLPLFLPPLSFFLPASLSLFFF